MSENTLDGFAWRSFLQVRIATESKFHPGGCSAKQAAMVARYTGALFPLRCVRLAVLGWLVQRPIKSSKALTAGEAHVLLDWLSAGSPAETRAQAASLLAPALMAEIGVTTT